MIKIKERDKWKTVFWYKYGHFKYIVLPLGFTNVLTIFYIIINKNLKGLVDQIYIMFLNDIFIYFNIFEKYKKYIKNVLKRFNQYNFFINLNKCKFYIQKVFFLGFVISSEGIFIEIDCIQTILQWLVFRSVYNIQVFLGFIRFYRRFIKGYSKVTVLLINLFRKSIFKTFDLDINGFIIFTKVKFLFIQTLLL